MRRFYIAFLSLILCWSLTSVAAPKRAPKKKPSPAQQAPAPAPQDAQTQPPQPPPTPEHGPASPPDVKYQAGQLTIVARNSNMSDVLSQVKQKTGASVDMPAASNERVVGQFGPGAPRDVMAQLLNGSHYDYVLLGSPTEPTSLRKIVLMARATGPEPAQQVAAQPQRQGFQPNPNIPVPQEADSDQTVVEENSNEPDQAEQPEQPEMQEQEEPQPGQAPGAPPNGQPVVKSPEQLLRELQQQQQQQQQNPEQNAPGAPPR